MSENLDLVPVADGANLFEIHDGEVTGLAGSWDRHLAFADLGLAE